MGNFCSAAQVLTKLLPRGISHLKTAELHEHTRVTLGPSCDDNSSQIWRALSWLRWKVVLWDSCASLAAH